MDDELESTWATRELPILRAALREVDAGETAALEKIRQELGLPGMQVWAAVKALSDAGYIDVDLAMGWRDDHASGDVVGVSERARRELGTWPSSADDFVAQLAAAFGHAADQEPEPERKGRLRSAADTLTGSGATSPCTTSRRSSGSKRGPDATTAPSIQHASDDRTGVHIKPDPATFRHPAPPRNCGSTAAPIATATRANLRSEAPGTPYGLEA